MAKKKANQSGKKTGMIHTPLGRLALIGGAAWATVKYFQSRAKRNNLDLSGNRPRVVDNYDDPSQTGRWPGVPADKGQDAKMPEVQPDNMPGDTEQFARTNYQRY